MKYVAKSKLSQDHAVNTLPVVFFHATDEKNSFAIYHEVQWDIHLCARSSKNFVFGFCYLW